MKIAFVTDTHYGIRNDSTQFHEYFGRFFSESFFPTIDKLGVSKVVHLGDIVDRRKFVNILTAQQLREQLIAPLIERGIPMDVIAGNHDTYYKNTNEVNALNELLRDYEGITAYTKTTEVDLGGVKTLYIPWICPENRDESFKKIDETNATIALGHLEIAGFTLHPGHVMDESGLAPSTFKKFELTCSGHFHHRHDNQGIHYLGCPYEMTWSDYGNAKGFHIFDTDDRSLTFYPNPFTMFTRITYEPGMAIEPYKQDINKHYVKFVVQDNLKQSEIESIVSEIEKHDPYEIRVIDESSVLLQEDVNIDEEDLQDTLTIVGKYIDNIDTTVDREAIHNKIVSLYRGAMTVE